MCESDLGIGILATAVLDWDVDLFLIVESGMEAVDRAADRSRIFTIHRVSRHFLRARCELYAKHIRPRLLFVGMYVAINFIFVYKIE